MKRTTIAAGITLIGVIVLGVEGLSLPGDGGPAATFVPNGSCALRVVSATRAGTALRPGDMLALQQMSPPARIMVTQGSSRVGESYELALTRDGRQQRITETVAAAQPLSSWIVSAITKLVIFFIGLFVLWRGRDAASYHYGTASVLYSLALLPISASLLPPLWRSVFDAGVQVLGMVGGMNLFLMFEDLGREFISARALRACRIIVVAALALAALDALEFAYAAAASGCYITWLKLVHLPLVTLSLIVMAGVLAATYLRARGERKQRVRWVFWSTLVGFTGVIVWTVWPSLQIAVLTSIAIPIGYAYAILRHRVIDVSFVVNRAIVFTVVTTFVFGVFAVLSTLIERVTVFAHAGTFLEAGVALALAFSFDFIYKRIESFVDRLFFGDKHAAEVAVRQFADEACFFGSVAALRARVVDVATHALRASRVAIYEPIANGYHLAQAAGEPAFPDSLDRDDPALLKLCAYLKDVNLAEVRSAAGSDGYAFAMVVRGQLTGVLIARKKASDEDYDPAERVLLRVVARELATALEVLHAADQVELVAALAEGSIDLATAEQRARDIIARE